MGVIRVEHNSNYTVMSNEHLRDPRLSLRAMGLMSRMLSDSDSYQHSVAGLAAVCKEGRDAVRKALQELEAAGYLIREQTRQGGSFAACDYTLYEHSRSPFQGEEHSPLTENPSTVNPSTEKPSSENPTQRNTKSKEVPTKEPPKPPRGPRAKKEKPACEYEPEMFERFWKMYPRGEDKAAARYEWDLLRPDLTLMRTMSAALKSQMKTDEWRRGVGIPYACRWLSKRRWEAAEKLIEQQTADPTPAPIEEAEIWL